MWYVIAGAVAAIVIAFALWPRSSNENNRLSSIGNLRFPRSEEGVPIPLVLGRVRVEAPNTLWFGNFRATEKYKIHSKNLFGIPVVGLFISSIQQEVFEGYEYHVDFALNICLGPDVKLYKIWVGKKVIWEGEIGSTSKPSKIDIDEPLFFGGPEQGGGFVAKGTFYNGSFTQKPDELLKKSDADPPAFIGQAYIVFEAMIGRSPNMRPLSFEVSRYTNTLGLNDKAKIGDDMNPAEALIYILMGDWGCLKIPQKEIDLDSFRKAGETLFDEKNGLSMAIEKNNEAQNLIREILRQINATLFHDSKTGKIVLKLIRDDYTIAELPKITANQIIEILQISQNTWSETANQVRLTYLSRDDDYREKVALSQDMGNIVSQNKLRTTVVSYPGIKNSVLANQISARELSYLSVPILRIRIRITHQVDRFDPGDVFTLTWPEYGFENIAFRVQRCDNGDLYSSSRVIDAVQNVFSSTGTVFAPPEKSEYVPLTIPAELVENPLLIEAPRIFVTGSPQNDQPVAIGFMGFATAASEKQQSYLIKIKEKISETSEYQAISELGEAITASDDEIKILLPKDFLEKHPNLLKESDRVSQRLGQNLILLVGHKTEMPPTTVLDDPNANPTKDNVIDYTIGNEFISYTSFIPGPESNEITLKGVSRGILDTTPKIFPKKAKVYWLESYRQIIFPPDETGIGKDLAYGDEISANFISRTPKDEKIYTYEKKLYVNFRSRLPYPPCQLTIQKKKNDDLSVSSNERITITWKYRSEFNEKISLPEDPPDRTTTFPGEYKFLIYLYSEYLNDWVEYKNLKEGIAADKKNFATFTLPNLHAGETLQIIVRSQRTYLGADSTYPGKTFESRDYAWLKATVKD